MAKAASASSTPSALRLLPSYMLFLTTLLSLIPLPIPFFSHVSPAFSVMAIIYFTLWQPRYTPFLVIFGCGLFFDAFQSSLFGTHALLFILLRLAVAYVRNTIGFTQHIGRAWCFAALILSAYFIIEWLMLSAQFVSFGFPAALLQRDMLSITLYPLIHISFSALIAKMQ